MSSRPVMFSCCAVAAALVFVKATSIGPVVAVVSARHGWGVHAGDAFAAPFSFTAAWVTVTVVGVVSRTTQGRLGRPGR